MTRPRIVVVGGGLAGLSAAVACADAGARVVLLEARPRLGGATWSVRRRGMWIDNGQHVFLRCCTAYRGFLHRLGVDDRVELQDRLSIPVVSPGGKVAWLRRGGLPAPFHLAPALLRYAHLGWRDRLRVASAARRLARLDLADPDLDRRSFGSWLDARGQSATAVERFWDLIARGTLNAPVSEASLALAAKVFQTGLLTEAGAGDIGCARVPLQQLHAEPAARVLRALGARIGLRSRVDRVELASGGTPLVLAGSRRIGGDAVIVAVPHGRAAELLPASAEVDGAALARLGASPIVNLHVVYDRPVTDLALAVGVGSPVQWVFDRTEAAGLERGQYLAVSLSAADAYLGVSIGELRRSFEPELGRIFPVARRARIERFFATCERAATFHPSPGTAPLRLGARTAVAGIYLAGAWTDTGWPATMEGAVRSGLTAARAALQEVRLEQYTDAAA